MRFVVQKHAARRLHYDLRLELDGVFKSWAVTRGPSLDPADKRLAVQVEDHPLDYGDFEGTIPQGQYGGGTVQLWDRGYWAAQPGTDAQAALASGQLKFSLDGQRLRGQWVLVRMRHAGGRDAGKRVNWLLIKHRDAAADSEASRARSAAPLAEDRSVASGRSMAQIAAGRAPGPVPFMRAARGRARSRPDAVWQSARSNERAQSAAQPRASPRGHAPRARPMPDFVEPQLCKLVDRPPEGEDWVHEVKLDGYRLQLRVQDSSAALRTRKGLDWTARFPEICSAVRALPDCLMDGEVVGLDPHGMPSFETLQVALSEQRTAQLLCFVFDLLYAGGQDLRALPLAERKQRLRELLGERAGPLRYVEHFQLPGRAVLESACRMSLEGIVSKRLNAPYSSGRGGGWVKSKCRAGQEVVIGGWSSEAGALRSLLVGVQRGGRLHYAGKVGTGFTRKSARRLQARFARLASGSSPFTGGGAPKRAAGVQWLRPQLVAEIEFSGWTTAGLVRQGAFKGLREDKPAAEVGVEVPQRAEEVTEDEKGTQPAAAPAVATAAASRASAEPRTQRGPARESAVVLHVQISQPDKALWPAAETRAGAHAQPITKLELARYFEAAGPWLIDHIRGRPCSLLRAPDGIGGQKFLQRHAMPGLSGLIDLVRLSGDRKPYVVINRVEGLIAAAQIAALELHPWNCVPERLEVPGRLVFDLDPAPDVPFEQVIHAALQLRERLCALGLETFCKTTGGKGLHVVTPLALERVAADWTAAKGFARAVCEQMAADSPQRYLTSMARKARVGRIFLDYLRNDRMSTAVAPLSARARPGATVSMPLTWQQVRRGLDPQRYTLRTALALLTRSNPWADYDEAARSLRAAGARLIGRESAAARAAGGRKHSLHGVA